MDISLFEWIAGGAVTLLMGAVGWIYKISTRQSDQFDKKVGDLWDSLEKKVDNSRFTEHCENVDINFREAERKVEHKINNFEQTLGLNTRLLHELKGEHTSTHRRLEGIESLLGQVLQRMPGSRRNQ